MEYISRPDADQVAGTPDEVRLVQRLLGPAAGVDSCRINWIRTPPGSGSPEGLHYHRVDQIFYILQGTMNLEIAGSFSTASAGDLVVFPAGVHHQNWNESNVVTVHLAINAPAPDPTLPFAIRVDAGQGAPGAASPPTTSPGPQQ